MLGDTGETIPITPVIDTPTAKVLLGRGGGPTGLVTIHHQRLRRHGDLEDAEELLSPGTYTYFCRIQPLHARRLPRGRDEEGEVLAAH